MAGSHDIDKLSGTPTTGHSWDGIKELNTPLPRWWLWTFYATVVFSIGYMVVYPGIPGSFKGAWNWSSREVLRGEMKTADDAKGEKRAKIASTDIAGILADNDLRTFAVAAGAAAFKVNCVQCHGSGAQGGPGYPNLNDDSWIWGGKPEDIVATIAHGIRDPIDAETRVSEMPRFGDTLNAEQIAQVANYVGKLANLEHDAALATAGEAVWTEQQCQTCHGAKGEGVREMGGPMLTDAIWLYGGTVEAIAAQVKAPRHGVMPAWQSRLGETAVKELAAYVHSLGGGEAP